MPCTRRMHTRCMAIQLCELFCLCSAEPFSTSPENRYLIAATVFCCILAVVWLLIAFMLSLGYPRSRLACMRHNAIGNILGGKLSGLCCASVLWLLSMGCMQT